MTDKPDKPDITIHPQPTDEELAAIIAVIESIRPESGTEPHAPKPSPWTTAARRGSLRGQTSDS